MMLGSMRRLFAIAIVLPIALPACGEKATPDPAPAATTAAAMTTSSATSTVTATATAEPTSTATAEPTATATATSEASGAPSAKPVATTKPTSSKPKSTAVTHNTASPSADPSSAPSPTATAVTIAPPAEGSADAIAQKVDNVFAPKKDFTAKFKQKLEQKVSGTKKESTGVAFIERPNKASFRYDAPNKNRMVSDGKTFKAYVAEDSQMFESQVTSSSMAGGLSFFMDGLLKTMSFTFNTKADYKGGYVIIGKPRTPSAAYDSVMFYINKDLLEKGDAGCIERIVIIDAQGNKNRFDFTEASFPASVPATEWEFTPPAGTNITKN